MNSPKSKGEELAKKWLKRFASVRDAKLRRHVALKIIDEETPFATVVGLSFLLSRGGGTFSKVDEALESFVDLLTEKKGLTYERRRDLYAEAMECSLTVVGTLFLQMENKDDEDVAATRSVVPGQKPLSRGERKALARAHRIDLIRALTNDPDPMVVEILLENPHLTEDDVVKMAAKRPTSGHCQELIYKSLRWRPRYHVRLALAKNPRTSFPVAMCSMVSLRSKDLKAIASDGMLPEMFRKHAYGLVELRHSEIKTVH